MSVMGRPRNEFVTKLRGIGVSPAHASMINTGKRRPSLALCLKIYRETGIRLPRLSAATDEQIAALEAVTPEWRPKWSLV